MHQGRIVSPEYIYGKLILQTMCGNVNLCSLSCSSPENLTLQVCQSRLSHRVNFWYKMNTVRSYHNQLAMLGQFKSYAKVMHQAVATQWSAQTHLLYIKNIIHRTRKLIRVYVNSCYMKKSVQSTFHEEIMEFFLCVYRYFNGFIGKKYRHGTRRVELLSRG